MYKYKVWYVGYDTTSSGKIERCEIIEANSEEEAKEVICGRSYMGGYDYYINRIEKVSVENG